MMRNSKKSVKVPSKTVRLDIQLSEPDDSSYNSVSYAKLVNLELGIESTSSDLLGLNTEDTYDRFKGYEEESYIDNTEAYRHTLPAELEPELGGFYVNTGKLKLKSSSSAPNLVNKNKKEGKKKIPAKTKAVKTKTVRKKESILPKVKKPKHENSKIRVNHKVYNNIRLDALLKTVRKQKKNGIVKRINMSNTSKHRLFTDTSKKANEVCNIMPKKKVNSVKKCVNTSVSTTVILNATEVTIPREDFLSSKASHSNSLCSTSTSDSDEITIVKEIIHPAHKNNNGEACAKNNLNLKRAVSSESVRVASSNALHSPSATITKEKYYLSLNPFSPILDWEKASPTTFQTAVTKETFSQVAVEPDFITCTSGLKTTKPLSLPKAIVTKNIDSNRKVFTDSTLAANSSLPDTVVRSNSAKATSCFSSKPTKAPKRSNSSKGTIKLVRSRSSKSTIPNKKFHSPCHSAREYAFSQGVSLKASKSKTTKATVKPINSSSIKATIPKEVSYSSPKVAADPDFSANSLVLNTEVRSSFSKVTTPKEALLSICAAEYALFQDVPSTKPTGNILVNEKDLCPANSRGSLKVNSTSPKAVSKCMLKVIQDNDDNKIPSNTISTNCFSSCSQSDVYHYDNNLESDKSSIRTYSKANKNSLQPKVKTNPAATCSVPVSQTKPTTVVNPNHSSYNAPEVKMYKMNISPIVKIPRKSW